MRPEVKAWLKATLPSVDIEALSDDEVKNLEADYDGRQVTRKAASKPASDPFEERKLEAQRRKEIREIAEELMEAASKRGDIEACNDIQKMYDHAIEAKMSPKDYRHEMIVSGLPGPCTINPTRDRLSSNPEDYGQMLTAAVCLAGRLSNIEAHFTDQTLDRAEKKFGRGIGLRELYAKAASFNGYKEGSYDVTIDMHRYACGLVPPAAIRASAFSTISLPGILSNIANKFLQEGWGGGEMVWRDVTAIRSVRDFKQVSSYKLNGHLKYEKVGAAGEIKHGQVSEETYTNQAATYGRMFAVTRTDLINDDLGALTQVPRELGYGANEAFNEVFWTEFLSSDATFFDGSNSNTATGTATANTILATLAAAELVFMQQTKPNGTPLGIMPDRILAPNATHRIFRAAMTSGLVVGSTGPTPNVNTFQGDYSVHTSAYMSNSAYTGHSAAKWYLLANPARLALIETAFLNGRDAPIVETEDASFNTLGVQMRGYHDFGCKLQEYRAGVQGSGA